MRRTNLGVLVLVLLGAAFLRLYGLITAPPGLFHDEGINGLDALSVLRGGLVLDNLWREPLYRYLVTPFVGVMGRTPLAVRLPAALVGIGTVAVTFCFVRELFADVERPWRDRVALLSAALLAVSYWHVNFSRIAFGAITLPFALGITSWLFWRAVHRNRLDGFLLFGLAMGVTLYTYLASRLAPLIPSGYLVLQHVVSRSTSQLRRFKRGWVLATCLCVLIGAPLGIYYLLEPAEFLGRVNGVSVFTMPETAADPVSAIPTLVVRTLAAVVWNGDQNWRHNLPGRPMFPLPLNVGLLIGVVVSLRRIRKGPYIYLLAWALVMLVPSMLAFEGNPHHLRTIGAAPALCVLVAVGILAAADSLRQRVRFGRFIVPATVWSIVVYSGIMTYRDYFDVWATRHETFNAFDGEVVKLASNMNGASRNGAVFVLPIGFRWPLDYIHYTLDYLYHGEARRGYLRVDEATVSEDLAALVGKATEVYLVEWTEGEHVDADPKGVLPFALDRVGDRVKQVVDVGTVLTEYRLPVDARIDLPVPAPVDGPVFEDKLRVRGVAGGEAAVLDPELGRQVWAVVRWEALAPLPVDYKIALHVRDERGRLLAQTDRPLMSNHHEFTSGWQLGQSELGYYLVTLPPGSPPGAYYLTVVVYDPADMRQLALPGGGTATSLGAVCLETPQIVADPKKVLGPAVRDGRFGAYHLVGVNPVGPVGGPGTS